MAPLASIPEANTSLRSTFDTHCPRSRAVFLSRRPSRPRSTTRKLVSRKRPGPKNYRAIRHPAVPEADPQYALRSCMSPRLGSKSSTRLNYSSAAVADVPEHLRKSESPFDLDSFPQPPTSSSHLRPRNRSSNIDIHPHGKHYAPKPPLALSQRKLLASNAKGPANIRCSLRDAAVDLMKPTKRQSVDSTLVAAVTRSIAQQLRLYSNKSQQRCSLSQQRSFSKFSESEASSHKQSVKCFEKNLKAYAEQESAKGRIIKNTSTPPTDTATLNTVAELLPFRSQFRAAGLAVTSKEQASGVPKHLRSRRLELPAPRRHLHADHRGLPAQVDGYLGSSSSAPTQSINTEISFAEPEEMDDFRYALIDEAPVRKKKSRIAPKGSARRCLPCFPGEDDYTTDTDWAHFKTISIKPGTNLQKGSVMPVRRVAAVRNQPSVPPAQGHVGSVSRSPHQQSNSHVAHEWSSKDRRADGDRPNFITTGRRHSLAMPKSHSESIDCSIKHRQRPDRANQAQEERDIAGAQRLEQQPLTDPNKPVTEPKSRSLFDSQRRVPWRPQRTDRLLDLQVDGQRGPRRRRPKRPLSINRKITPVFKYDPGHIGICCPKNRGVPAKLTARPNIPQRTSSIRGSHDSTELDYDDREIADRDVLRGLHVAASAACNEEIDAFVRNRTGLRIRRFLADLMVLETLTAIRPGEGDEQHARRRRAEMRKLKQQVRRSREIALTGGVI